VIHSLFRSGRSPTLFWFALSLTVAAVYSLLALQIAFSGEFVVQDDARQHVFWMRRFLNPDLFPNDWIADYFQSVAPLGYQGLYRGAALLGIDPLWLSKILPLILNLVAAAYCFGVVLLIFPVPVAGFCSSVLLGQSLGLTDAVVSGTPKAFIYALFLPFLYYLLRRSPLPCAAALGLLGLFYPQVMLVGAGLLVLRLFTWRQGKIGLITEGRDRRLCVLGLGAAFLVLLPYAVLPNPFGPAISARAARQLPEFLPGGRSAFFNDADPWSFWTKGRGGLRIESVFTPVTHILGPLLPLGVRYPRIFPLARSLTRNGVVLPQLLVASLGLFAVAHLLLFRLHLPSRYTEHSLRVLLALSAGIMMVMVIDALFQWAVPRSPAEGNGSTSRGRRSLWKTATAWGGTGVLAIALLFYPAFVAEFPLTRYIIGTEVPLYRYLRTQPVDTLTVSLDLEANNLPTFAQRPILTGDEYAIPYHVGYYSEIRQRTLALIRAQYSLDPILIQNFINTYGVDFWLVRPAMFNLRWLQNNAWIQQYQPAANEAIATLEAGAEPLVQQLVPRCTLLEGDRLSLLDAECLVTQLTLGSN
jgi:hypothetical protein